VITIIGLLVALLLPALSSARATAVASGANMNLNGFGRAFLLNADQDTSERGALSTGAFDLHRDGDIRKVGWVADVIKLKVANPNKANDGSNPSKLNEKLLDYTGAVNLTNTKNINPRIWTATSNVYYGVATGPASAASWTSGDRLEQLWNAGFNSNFATSWHFSRGDQKIASGSTAGQAGGLTNDADTRDRGKSPLDGEGPLSEQKLGACKATRDQIALMANARNGDGGDAKIDTAVATTINNFFGFETGSEICKSGEFGVESFTDGKNCTQYSQEVAVAYGVGSAAVTTDTTTHDKALHEVQDFYPVVNARKDNQGLFAGGYAQVLFADGHVGKIKDEGGYNGEADGWIGPNKVGGAGNASNSSAKYELTASGLKEMRNKIWIEDLGGTESGAGGGE